MIKLEQTEVDTLDNCVLTDTRSMMWITGLSPEECASIAISILAKRVSFIFDTMPNDVLQHISKGEIDFPSACREALIRVNGRS